MARETLDYHRSSVLDGADDHRGMALDYFTEGGEQRMVWGGSAAARLGLHGPVLGADYDRVYGPGGARDDRGIRLAATRRPGLELVISLDKSVAELGVIGRTGTCMRSWMPNVTPRSDT